MATRLIPLQVTNEYIKGDGVVIGAANSHDDVVLRIAFNDMWEGYSKHITWLNSYGLNPTLQYLTTNLLVTGTTNTYDVAIPTEAKEFSGEVTMSIKGAITSGTTETRATLSAVAKFNVLESVYDSSAEETAQPTASIADQLQDQIDEIVEDIEDAREAATEAQASATSAANSATSASTSASSASTSATNASTYASNASTSAANASNSATSASTSASTATSKATEASGYATTAGTYKDQALAAKIAIENMTASASASASSGTTPTVTVTKTTVSDVTNLDFAFGLVRGEKGDTGATGETGAKGDKGDTGDDGTDGVSPTLTSSKSGKKTTVYYTDVSHTTPTVLAEILDGADGQGSGDMLKSVYDQDGDGVVDDAEKLGGQLPSYYATASAISDMATQTWVGSGYVAKETGKGLSTNDYDDTEKSNVASNTTARHTHSNKTLLDNYDQTNTDLTDAVSKKHEHSNKALLDTYTQTESNLASAVTNTHTHSNKALLDTYTQTENDIASAVTNTHTHSNKSTLDGIASTDITNWNSVVPTVVTGTLSAGSTTLTLSNSAITTTSVLDIYTDVYGVNPTALTVASGSVTMTFDSQSSAVNVRLEVR